MLVDEIQGMADLAAFDATDRHRARTLALGAELDAVGVALAGVRGLNAGATTALIGLTAVAILVVAIPLVAAGRLDGVYLAVLPLAAIAAFEAVQPLTLAVQLLETGSSGGRPALRAHRRPAGGDGPVGAGGAADLVRPRDPRACASATSRARRSSSTASTWSVPAGTSLAILGPSGAGKSTLVNLLLRFWEYAEGEIRVGGRELRELAADDARRLFGVVSQQVHLFDASLRDNLALADPDVTDEQVERVCRAVQLHDFVQALPQGYRTMVGENGVRLSGGERQRLAIARAMIRDAPILVLDEATANLDALTEQRLMDAIAPFMAGRTTLLISHRPALARLADAAVVIEGGRARPALPPRSAEGSCASAGRGCGDALPHAGPRPPLPCAPCRRDRPIPRSPAIPPTRGPPPGPATASRWSSRVARWRRSPTCRRSRGASSSSASTRRR